MTDVIRSAYLDTSALVKLAKGEVDSAALSKFARPLERFSSEIAQVELKRAVRRNADRSSRFEYNAAVVADSTQTIPMDYEILKLAGDIEEPNLGTLDAIHISTAISAAPFDCFVTYDNRQADAARAVGLNVVIPRDPS